MPKRAKELSALAVARLKIDGRHAVGGASGLHLRVSGTSRSWVLRAVVGAVRRDMGLGSYPDVSLAEARARAAEYRRQVRDGLNPVAQRRLDRQRAKSEVGRNKTFKECAESFIALQRVGWTNPKHAKQWASTLATYAYPVIGNAFVSTIGSDEVLRVLQQPQLDRNRRSLWESKNETADRVRNRIEQVLDWAKFKGYREGENPARWRGNLDNELPASSKVQNVRHHPSLPHGRVNEFIADLRGHEGTSAKVLEFAILTAARSSEVRGAVWTEIDFETKTWTIPANRMKGRRGRTHRVPLSAPALRLLAAIPRADGSKLVFPNVRGAQLSDAAQSSLMEDMHNSLRKRGGIGYLDPIQDKIAVPHGFRSSFKDWARSSTKYADEVSELALAHINNDATRSAYARDELMPLRAKLMDDWARYINSGRSNNVVPFPNAKTHV